MSNELQTIDLMTLDGVVGGAENWEQWLGDAGGAAGGVGGAALGSWAGGVPGAAIGSVLGSVGGAAAGRYIGRQLDNPGPAPMGSITGAGNGDPMIAAP